MSDLPLLLTKTQAAKALGVSASTFNGWVQSGIMPGPIAGTSRWSRVQIERAASGQTWIPAEGDPSSGLSPFEEWEQQEAAKSRQANLHSYGNAEFDPDGPLGKREIRVLSAAYRSDRPLPMDSVLGASVATIEKLGMRGFLKSKGHFYELALTEAGKREAQRLERLGKLSG